MQINKPTIILKSKLIANRISSFPTSNERFAHRVAIAESAHSQINQIVNSQSVCGGAVLYTFITMNLRFPHG